MSLRSDACNFPVNIWIQYQVPVGRRALSEILEMTLSTGDSGTFQTDRMSWRWSCNLKITRLERENWPPKWDGFSLEWQEISCAIMSPVSYRRRVYF
jgi:hypothetical protein